MKTIINKNNICWHKYPEEKPDLKGKKIHYYLVRGIGGIDEKLHFWICQYIKTDDLPEGWYINGNEFREAQGKELFFVDVDDLYPLAVNEK